jgi:hypothetical protein
MHPAAFRKTLRQLTQVAPVTIAPRFVIGAFASGLGDCSSRGRNGDLNKIDFHGLGLRPTERERSQTRHAVPPEPRRISGMRAPSHPCKQRRVLLRSAL